MQSEEKKLSFGFSVSDEKINLIDILTENDDFLVDSPFCASDSFSDSNIGFRVSGFRNSPELEMLQQNDQNQLPSHLMQLRSPSFHRKSLAWDSRFFDSPGVLDPDELSCINTGIKTTEAHLQKRISELKSRPNDDAGFSADWFEIEPSRYKPKSTKMFNVASKALKKVNRSFRNEVKSNQTCTGKSSNKVESTVKRVRGPISSSPRLPNALERNISTISNNSRNLSGIIGANNNSGSSAQTPSHLKRKTESRESRLQNKNISKTTLSSSVDIKKQRSKIHLDVMKSFRGALVGTDENEASRLLNTPKQYSRICSVGSLSANSFKPSELRPPSPQIGFFDENKFPRYHDTARNRSENVLSPDTKKASRHSWARKKLKGTCSEVAKKNIKRPKTDHTDSSFVTDQENRAKKNVPSSDVDQLGTLSRFFAAIDLKEEKLTQLKKRAPLADKTSSYNSGKKYLEIQLVSS
ncbi:hypothetical protein CASFOL_006185 [Castilleja foliolosa]|uniref:Uncharacterized protein n=1 Tax=Castilleja foliolosa TaxID=1961234 RepID=A0ABD3E679_9LAMI